MNSLVARGTEVVTVTRGNVARGGTEVVKPILLRGFGLGGWLLPEGYMWKFYEGCDRPRRMEKLILDLCGKEYSRSFWKQYFDTYITEKDIELISREGFNSIRLPFNSRTLISVGSNGSVDFVPEMIGLIDRCIGWCRKNGLYVILDMHGAPGGQTGTNIDDCENDLPELFTNPVYQDQCVTLWRMLAERYAEESTIAGYDLMNEPLPDWFSTYNDRIIPLYRRIRDAIREVDSRHMIILEGAHWATDWTIFDELEADPIDDNCLLQFHKYWSNPDKPSLEKYLEYRERLQMPIFMGEGGENNLLWYTGIFPLYEQLGISWNFWTYKKMECTNSPITFPVPKNWPNVLEYIKQGKPLDRDSAVSAFNQFLDSLAQDSRINYPVFRSLKRELPLSIPAEQFLNSRIITSRMPENGANLRLDEKAVILFCDGHHGDVDFCRYGGEKQPEDQLLCVQLKMGEWLSYTVSTELNIQCLFRMITFADEQTTLIVQIDGDEVCKVEIPWNDCEDGKDIFSATESYRFPLSAGTHELTVGVEYGAVKLHMLKLDRELIK
jgi:endoglucanase